MRKVYWFISLLALVTGLLLVLLLGILFGALT